jgi:hypothetical protein
VSSLKFNDLMRKTNLRALHYYLSTKFVRREYMVSKSHSVVSAAGSKDEVHSWFGVRTCQSMLESLLALDDIDVDILVLLRDEVIILQRMQSTLRFRNLVCRLL